MSKTPQIAFKTRREQVGEVGKGRRHLNNVIYHVILEGGQFSFWAIDSKAGGTLILWGLLFVPSMHTSSTPSPPLPPTPPRA